MGNGLTALFAGKNFGERSLLLKKVIANFIIRRVILYGRKGAKNLILLGINAKKGKPKD